MEEFELRAEILLGEDSTRHFEREPSADPKTAGEIVRALKLWPSISWINDTEGEEAVTTIPLNRAQPDDDRIQS